MDTKATCSCKHPAAEHSKIEGLDGLGHCKVPGCECGAFEPVNADAPSQQAPAYHTLIARATNADGTKGVNLIAPKGVGEAISVPQEVGLRFGESAEREYKKLFEEDPAHTAVTALPYLRDHDEEVGGYNMPVESGIHLKGEKTLEKAIGAIEEAAPILRNMPYDSLRPKDRLLIELEPIDIELAGRVLLDEYETPEDRLALANKLTEVASTPSIELANRIRSGEFGEVEQ